MPRHDPLAALRQRNFLYFSLGRFCYGAASMSMAAAIAWQVYDISGSALHIGLIGLARFAPSLGLSLVGGALADTYDRRRIATVAQCLMLLTGLVLLVSTASGSVSLPLIYAAAFLIAVFAAFDGPARTALVPWLVTPASFPNAIVVGSTVQQLSFVTGPALAGGLIAIWGVDAAYAAFVTLLGCSVISLALLRPRRIETAPRSVSFEAIKEGVQFVRSRQVILGAMTLDMFAVIFGGATALLPIYAKDILDVGSVGYGLLYASLDLGALITSIALVVLPPIQRTGRALLIAVVLFGIGTIVFGLSRNFALSLVAYMAIGMADQVSVVMRQTTIQLATPDALRGRVTSVNMLFIGASNQLGMLESGLVAAATSATFAVVSGGAGCLAVVAAVAARMPELRRYRISDGAVGPEPPKPATPPAEASPAPAEGSAPRAP